MRHFLLVTLTTFALVACGGSQSTGPATGENAADTSSGEEGGGNAGDDTEFQLNDSDTAGQAHGERPSEIEASATHAAMRLFVVDPETGPIQGIVIKMTGPEGTSYYTEETDSVGYAEVLVPIGQRYEIEYLSLGRRSIAANVEVANEPNRDIRLTMRYRRWRAPERPQAPQAEAPQAESPQPQPRRFVLDGITFETGSANIQEESFPRLARVVEYMTHRTSARIRISGHTDNVGNPQANQTLSEARAEAVRDYLVSQGIDGGRIEAVGFGDQQPVATNNTDAGRQQNRRIEAIEL